VPDSLLRGHRQFRERYAGGARAFLQRLASDGQSPSALYVGCCDSRVVPEILTASSPGDLFVVRNIANLVPRIEHADASVGAAIDYAVGHLGVPHVIVCGHYGCGGVHAVIEGREALRAHPSLHEWLDGVEPAVARARAEGLDADSQWRRAVEENVVGQLANLVSYPVVADALEGGRLQLHGWVYDLHTQDLHVWDAAADEFRLAGALLGG
jgi:carbonic anhydrase